MKTNVAAPLDDFYTRSSERPPSDDDELDIWVAMLLRDLAADDLPAVSLDLSQLQSLIRGAAVTPAQDEADQIFVAEYFSPFTPKECRPDRGHTTVIYGLDGETAIDLCEGPSTDGHCPRALTPEGCVQCAGLWLGGSGWKFKAAEDATVCPVAMLGLA